MSSNNVIEPATATAARKVAPKTTKPKASRKAHSAKPAAAAVPEKLDRLPTTLSELKATKGGLVATLFLSGYGPVGIATELKSAFKLTEAQALKLTRRITGRVRLYQRILELVTAKR